MGWSSQKSLLCLGKWPLTLFVNNNRVRRFRWRSIWTTLPPLQVKQPVSLPPAIRQNPPLQRKNETSRACQVVVVKVKQTNKHAPISIKSLLYSFFLIRSGGRGDRSVAQDSLSDEPFRVRDMQQRIPERPESAAPPPGSQPAVEAAAEV